MAIDYYILFLPIFSLFLILGVLLIIMIQNKINSRIIDSITPLVLFALPVCLAIAIALYLNHKVINPDNLIMFPDYPKSHTETVDLLAFPESDVYVYQSGKNYYYVANREVATPDPEKDLLTTGIWSCYSDSVEIIIGDYTPKFQEDVEIKLYEYRLPLWGNLYLRANGEAHNSFTTHYTFYLPDGALQQISAK